jgi:hypothetical protein
VALEDAWSILKRQKPRKKHVVPSNPFNLRRNEIIRLQRALDSKPVVATRGNAGFHNKRRSMLRRKLEQLQQEEEEGAPVVDPNRGELVQAKRNRPKWLDDPRQTKYYALDGTGNPRSKTLPEMGREDLNNRLGPLFGRDSDPREYSHEKAFRGWSKEYRDRMNDDGSGE